MAADQQSDDPWSLIAAHRYAEAVAAFDAKPRADEGSVGWVKRSETQQTSLIGELGLRSA
jgi:hypothetical protein